jgi:UDP-N-acetyl-D-galactosamine dehydrogenase
VHAGVFIAESIRVAEAAKVIENTQRDINIALINELAIICSLMNIDTSAVLKAASTKWNFLKFEPGLVGGHCIGVDPFYLSHKAQILGYQPEVILAGRRMNDQMGKFIAQTTIKKMIHAGQTIKGAKVAILGLSFKENCPDLRNSKVVDIVQELSSFGIQVLVHDPVADHQEALKEYKIALSSWDQLTDCDASILAVKHRQYQELTVSSFSEIVKPGSVIVDVKSVLDQSVFQEAGYQYWRL